jgi:hypothetical protein
MEKSNTKEQPVGEDQPESASDYGSLKPMGEVVVRYQPQATEAPEGKYIHRRRPAPTVREGTQVPDRSPSPPVNVETSSLPSED